MVIIKKKEKSEKKKWKRVSVMIKKIGGKQNYMKYYG